MRRSLIVVLLIVAVLLLLPPGAPRTSSSHGPSVAPRSLLLPASSPVEVRPAGGTPHAVPRFDAPTALPPLRAWNTTLALTGGHRPTPLGGVPGSAVLDTSALPPTGTTPTVLSLLNQSTGCCFEQNVSVPTGEWARVVLNFTGTAVGNVYDSSYRAFLGGVQVMFGTSPEYGTWTVDQDVTPYVTLLHGTVNVTFLFGEALLGGHFVVNLSLAFYPTPAGTAPPPEPNDIIPLWLSTAVTPTDPTLEVNETMPSNVTNATLELWAYGFNPDEFWYTTMPGFRSFDVSVDGIPVASVLPFPYINTGGIDLFLWRPIPAAFTTSDRPYDFDATPLLGLLEGTHRYTADLQGISSGSRWILSGALLLNTSANGPYAAAGPHRAFSSTPHITESGAAYDEEANASYAWSSFVHDTEGGVTTVDGTLRTLYTSNISLADAIWENLTLKELSIETVNATGPSGSWWENRTLTFTLDVDLGDVSVITSTTGGGYPKTAEFNDSFLNGLQSWVESDGMHAVGGGRSGFVGTNLSNTLDEANGVYSGTEKLTSPNAGQITSYSSIQSLTPEVFDESRQAENLSGSYAHAVTGSDFDPPGPNNVENITRDVLSGSLDASATVSSSEIDLGQNATFTAQTLGGVAPYQYLWGDLPAGCASVSAPTLLCHPIASGPVSANVTVTDVQGDQVTAVVGLLQVEPALAVTWGLAPNETDAGATVSYDVSIAGGLGPYACAWAVDGTVEVATQTCGAAFNVTWTGPAPADQTVNVRVTDALGGSTDASWIEQVQLPPDVGILRMAANASSLLPGTAVQLYAVAANGTGPYTWAWFLGSNLVAGSPAGPELNWTAPAPGVYSFTVQVVDAAGEVNISAPWVVTVHAPPAPVSSNPAESPGLTDVDGFFLVSGLAVLAVGALAHVAAGRQNRARPGRGPFPS